MKEKVIGFQCEPKLYRVGSFVLAQIPGVDRTLDEPDPTLEVLKVLGLTNASTILDMTIQKFWDKLEATGKVKQALALILTIEENPDNTPLDDIVKQMPRRIAGQVLADFFAMNFGSAPLSGVTAGSTASN